MAVTLFSSMVQSFPANPNYLQANLRQFLTRLLPRYLSNLELEEVIEQIIQLHIFSLIPQPNENLDITPSPRERATSDIFRDLRLDVLNLSEIEKIEKTILVYPDLCKQFLHNLLQELRHNNSNNRNSRDETTVEQPEQRLREAEFLRDDTDRMEALLELAPDLSEPFLKKILETILTFPNENNVKLFVSLVSHLPNSLIHDALIVIQSIENENSRATALVALIPRLSDSLIDTALVMARKIQEEENREKVLVKLIPQVSNLLQHNLLKKTLRTLQIRCEKQWQKERNKPNKEETRIKTVEELQLEAMVQLALSIPEYLKENILSRAINIAKNIENDVGKKVAIRQLIPHLSNSQLEELLPIVRELEDENLLADIIIKLAPHAPDSLLEEGLDAAQRIVVKIKQAEIQIGNSELYANQQKAEILAKLSPYLKDKDSLLEKALISAREIKDSRLKTNAVAVLACYSPTLQRDTLFQQEVFEPIKREMKGANEQDYFARDIFKKIAPYLSESLLQDALIIADRINNPYFRTETLASLIFHLPQSQQESVLHEYLFKQSQYPIKRINSIEVIDLIKLKSRLPESIYLKLKDEIWSKRALDTWNELNKANLLNEPRLALDTALLIPYLSDKLEDVLRKTLIIASQIDDNTRKELLELLGVYLSQLSSASIFPLWCDTLHILARRTRKDLLSDLSALTPVIKSLGGTQAIEETAYAIQDVGRWWS